MLVQFDFSVSFVLVMLTTICNQNRESISRNIYVISTLVYTQYKKADAKNTWFSIASNKTNMRNTKFLYVSRIQSHIKKLFSLILTSRQMSLFSLYKTTTLTTRNVRKKIISHFCCTFFPSFFFRYRQSP